MATTTVIDEALAALGKTRLTLAIHQAAFPPGTLDLGSGAPASAAGEELLRFARELGFNSLQVGPTGQTTAHNRSPYDGTVFARSLGAVASTAVREACDAELLTDQELQDAVAGFPEPLPGRSDAFAAGEHFRRLLILAQAKLQRRPEHPLRDSLVAFREEHSDWLLENALFEVMSERLGHDDAARFEPAVRALFEPGPAGAGRREQLRAVMRNDLERAELGQWFAFRDADRLRSSCRTLGLTLYGDLQVGWSYRDRFLYGPAFHPRFLLGAPPSRTNPEGQPWGYPILDPDQLDDPHSFARRLFRKRLNLAWGTHDGMRVDHPHGLVCPWVYEASALDPLRAVQAGCRLFESPQSADPDLARWSIARTGDLDTSAAPFGDEWVTQTTPAQVDRWARLMDEVVDAAKQHGVDAGGLSIEVLSTCPRPLRDVLKRHNLGRFRVTQKARVDDPVDVYRTDRAAPEDWVMLGSHDTPTLFALAHRWLADGTARERAAYLAARLEPDPAQRQRAVEGYCRTPAALAQAHLADLFLCDARHVLVHFLDLLCALEPYNRPGIVDPDNWSQRLTSDFATRYRAQLARGEALDIAVALATALRARGLRPELQQQLGTPSD